MGWETASVLAQKPGSEPFNNRAHRSVEHNSANMSSHFAIVFCLLFESCVVCCVLMRRGKSWRCCRLCQELDVKVAEEEAVSHSISNEQARPESPIRPGERLKAFLDYVHVQGASADLACHALALRSTLASDLATAAKHEEDLCQARASASAAVAAAATEVASTCSTEPELPSQDTGTVVQKEELRSKIDKLDPAMREIQREIEDAEQTQKELLQQVGILSEKLEVLRQRLSEKQK
eukprot:280676-Amphidinium_carterae.1